MTPALVFEDVCVAYDGVTALSGVTAALAPGVVTGIVGPNGAGKTTLLKAACGLTPLRSGACRIAGRDLGDWPRGDLARAVAYLPQGGELAWSLSAAEVVLLGRLPHGGLLARPRPADAAAVARALDRCDAARFARRRVDTLSAGERARVLLARALATEARILLADEPAAHLDPAHQLGMMAALRAEATRGVAVAVTLHELALAARYCDTLLVLHDGRLAAAGAPEAALADPVLAAVFGVAALRAAAPGGPPVPVPFQVLPPRLQ